MKRTIEDFIGGTPLARLQRLPGEDNARRGNVITSVPRPAVGFGSIVTS